ncbi:RNA polymerase sigma factor FliA [Mangrovimicrobium sediminis]|uniref:RNA polymerase sigma factor n=1 Tax=Mangrovimicrobium sediminis TaxID=2562682 RepID=A0A4Z0LTV0_9GAMM|nr:RNA polymerase sigma factor FliA [Haliea sp. SAOS-164]TGD70833.1 RNA polymerase sigma factor FliA [Haliea sp. SAOS-164]
MYTAKGKIEQRDLAEEYIPIVRRHALSLRVRLPASIDLEDLIQAGYLGLLDAMQRFDESSGTPFQAFASARIRGAMIDELRTRDWLPRSVRRKARALDESIAHLEQKYGRPPDEREIIDYMDMDVDEYHDLLTDTNNGLLLPLEQLVEEGWEPQGNGEGGNPYLEALYGEQREELIEAIDVLPEREKLLLALYYQEDLNLKEIGALMGVSESRVCQLHSQAVGRIRSRLQAGSMMD